MKYILPLAVALAATATPALAASGTSGAPTVALDATVPTKCEVRDYETTISFNELGPKGSANVKEDPLSIFCNVRFDAKLKSTNGRLKLNTGIPGAQPKPEGDNSAQSYSGFSSALDYKVTTKFGARSTATLTSNVDSTLGLGLNPINDTDKITYETIPEQNFLLGGTYNDTLTLTLTPINF